MSLNLQQSAPAHNTVVSSPKLDEKRRTLGAIERLLERDDVLILDTETTGLKGAEVIEVALIDTRGALLLDTLVCPKVMTMNPYAERVHGISLSQLEGKPSWPEVLPEVQRLTERATVLAWNAPFDARMLQQTSEAWGLSHPRILFACAMRLYARLYGRRSYALHRALSDEALEEVARRFERHRALGDVCFVLEVLREVVRKDRGVKE